MILEAILFRSHQVSTLILCHLDLPLPGGGGRAGVDINVDLIAGHGGRDEHMLTCVVATDRGGRRPSRVADSQTVHRAVAHSDAVRCRWGGGDSRGSCEDHRVKVNPQFADIRAGGTEGVGAGVAVSAGGVGRDDGVGVVGAATASTSDGEDTADSK